MVLHLHHAFVSSKFWKIAIQSRECIIIIDSMYISEKISILYHQLLWLACLQDIAIFMAVVLVFSPRRTPAYTFGCYSVAEYKIQWKMVYAVQQIHVHPLLTYAPVLPVYLQRTRQWIESTPILQIQISPQNTPYQQSSLFRSMLSFPTIHFKCYNLQIRSFILRY